MNSCEKNCSCEGCKPCNVPVSGVMKAIDICNIQPVPRPSTVENFVFNIQEEFVETDFYTLTLPSIALTGNQKVRLVVTSTVGGLTTSGPTFYIEDIYLTLQRNALPIGHNAESRVSSSMVKVDPTFNQYYSTLITLLYVDNPGPGIYTYSVDVKNESQNVEDPFIIATVITATIYNA
ncbi:hypothetical protein [Viridibacillus arvi]|uniref:Uncharacterized protein n=1 Tax=Viridibacillus arvi TaxID=263475 RepID=A0A0M0LCB7_9BACL|nr:hypothetical protein [Viridibacillus arvi]KOO48710.1 hypothetical protein AMD00_09735 [Viridibacillus arvi]